ncbi:MAG: hypothetical protein P1P71_09945, partial [Anaerosomatales bacterium]|nr:hypothetical protein [Anaerosomatales bacterium]
MRPTGAESPGWRRVNVEPAQVEQHLSVVAWIERTGLEFDSDVTALCDVVEEQVETEVATVDPMVVDLDHALGVVLWALSDVTLTLRAVGGQRLYAICRDIYDVAQLVARGADMSAALAILPDKAAVPG